MQLVRKCEQCQHAASLQGDTRRGRLKCTVCGFNREITPSELKSAQTWREKRAGRSEERSAWRA